MANQYGPSDGELTQSVVQHLRLHVDGDWAMIGPLAMTMSRPIKGQHAITQRHRRIEAGPVLTGPGIAMDENYGSTRTSNDEVKISIVNFDENRFGERVIVRHPRRDVLFLKSTGDAHVRAIWADCYFRREGEGFSYQVLRN